MHEVVVFTMARDEDPYIKDFVDFHLMMGVDHVMILDHCSKNPIKNLFKDHPKVTVLPFPGHKVHAEGWLFWCTYYSNFSKWGLLIDVDQFFVPANGLSIPEFCRLYENDPALCAVQVNWHTVGNSGHETKPEINQLLAFNRRAADDAGVNAHTQSLVRMDRVELIRWHNPHMAPPKPGFHNIGPDGNILIHTPFNIPISHTKASIYHLYTRSKEEFIHKQQRGRADIIGAHLDMSTYDDYNAFCNEVEDNTLADLYKKMKSS